MQKKIFNRNTFKISYPCIPNIKSKSCTHNKKILSTPVNHNTRKCICINKYTCPLNGNYLLENILYIVKIKSDKKNYQPRNFKEISEKTFKKRYENHKRSFNINRPKDDIKLSVEHWNLEAANSNSKVTRPLKSQFSAYKPQSKRCSLCLNEKLEEEEKIWNKQKIWSNIEVSSSKQVSVTNSCIEDPKPLCHI